MTFGKSFVGAAVIFGLAISAYDKKQIMEDCQYHLRRFGDKLQFPEPNFGKTQF
jgi:hypothetical protein